MNRGGAHTELSTTHLVAKSVTADHDWVLPARDWAGYLFENDGLTEHGPAKDVTDLVRCQLTYTRETAGLEGKGNVRCRWDSSTSASV